MGWRLVLVAAAALFGKGYKMDLSLDDLQEKPVQGESIIDGGGDFLAKLNSIITGINLLFENYQRVKTNISGQPGADQDQGKLIAGAPAVQGDTLKIVDQRLLYLVTQTFANKALNMPLNRLIVEYGEMSIVQAMEKAEKEGE